MIFQNDSRFSDPLMAPYGCKLMTAMWNAACHGNVELSVEEIEAFVEQAKNTHGYGDKPVIGDEFFINDTAALYTLLFGRTARIVYDGPGYRLTKDMANVIVELRYTLDRGEGVWQHWCAGHKGSPFLAYDPWRGGAQTVAKGKVDRLIGIRV